MSKITLTNPITLTNASDKLAVWVQQRLAVGGYLKVHEIDGVIGSKTAAAFAEFKQDVFLSDPHMIGQSSIDLLAKLEPPHPISEQSNFDQKPDSNAGSKTGKQIVLPIVGTKYLNEWIAPNCYLTYAEFTHGGSRLPKTEAQVRNMLQLAEQFGWIRRKFNAPLGITSAFRPEPINTQVGGRPLSWHPKGGALDIYPINGNMGDLTDVIKASPVGGVGIASKFRHIDLGNRRYWRYGR